MVLAIGERFPSCDLRAVRHVHSWLLRAYAGAAIPCAATPCAAIPCSQWACPFRATPSALVAASLTRPLCVAGDVEDTSTLQGSLTTCGAYRGLRHPMKPAATLGPAASSGNQGAGDGGAAAVAAGGGDGAAGAATREGLVPDFG